MDKVTCLIIHKDKRRVLLVRNGIGAFSPVEREFSSAEKSSYEEAAAAIFDAIHMVISQNQILLLNIANIIASCPDTALRDANVTGRNFMFLTVLDQEPEADTAGIDSQFIWANIPAVIAHPINRAIAGSGYVQLGLQQAASVLGITDIEMPTPGQTPVMPSMTPKQIHMHIANYLCNDLGLNKAAVSAIIEQMVARHDIPTLIDQKIKALIGKPGNQSYPQYLDKRITAAIDERLNKIITETCTRELKAAADAYAKEMANRLYGIQNALVQNVNEETKSED